MRPNVRNSDLLLGHVQQSNGVSFTVQVCSNSVQSFVKLSLDICELFKYFVGSPHEDLKVGIKQKTIRTKYSTKRSISQKKAGGASDKMNCIANNAVPFWHMYMSNKLLRFSERDDE